MSDAVEQNNEPRDWHHCACRFDVDDNETWTCSLHAALRERVKELEDAIDSHADDLLRDNAALRELVRVAACPNEGCGGQGWVARQFAAGEWEQEQCQWCYERWQLTKPIPPIAEPKT